MAADRLSLRTLLAPAMLVAVAVGALMIRMQPSIGWDPWRGILAAEQKLSDPAQPLTTVVVANAADVNRPWSERIEWWPPGQQMIVYAMRRAGWSLGASVKVLVIGSWAIGAFAWSAYFLLALGRRPLTGVVISLCLLHRASHASGFSYAGGEALLWAFFPVVALLYLWAWRRPSGRIWALALSGAMAGGLVVFKYTAAILAVALAMDGLIRVLRRQARPVSWFAWIAGCAIGASLWLISGADPRLIDTPAAALTHPNIAQVLSWNAAGPLMALSDVYDLTATLHRVANLIPPFGTIVAPISIALTVVWLAWRTTRREDLAATASSLSPAGDARTLAIVVCVTTSIVLTVLMLRGGIISFEGRHQQYGAFLVFPFFASAIVRSWKWTTTSARRAPAIACGLAFFLVPAAYGIVTLVHQSIVLMPRVRSGIGPTGVRIDWAATGAGARAFVQDIRSLPDLSSALLVTSWPDVALTFPEKRGAVVLSGGADDPRTFHGRPHGGALLIEPPFIGTAEVETIKRSFADVTTWTRIPIASVPGAQVWRGQ